MRINTNQSETKFSVRINPASDCSKPNFQAELIRIIPTWIHSNWFRLKIQFGSIRAWIDSDFCLGLNRIRLVRFLTVFHQTRYKTFFGMIRIGSDIDIGMNWNGSDWLEMNSYPILSSGYSDCNYSRHMVWFIHDLNLKICLYEIKFNWFVLKIFNIVWKDSPSRERGRYSLEYLWFPQCLQNHLYP